MRDVLRWTVVGCVGIWLLAGFGAWREGLSADELLDQVPVLVWLPRLAIVSWLVLVIGGWTVWKGPWVWTSTLAMTLMLLYPNGGWVNLIFTLPVLIWGMFRWRQRARAVRT